MDRTDLWSLWKLQRQPRRWLHVWFWIGRNQATGIWPGLEDKWRLWIHSQIWPWSMRYQPQKRYLLHPHNVVKHEENGQRWHPILCHLSVRFAEEACAVIMSDVFSPCHILVNPSPFQRFCRYDVCACGDGEKCLCSALAAYAASCSAKGVLVNWRSALLCGKFSLSTYFQIMRTL